MTDNPQTPDLTITLLYFNNVFMLYQLAYASFSRLPLQETTLSDILGVSRRNNSRDEITGILMYEDRTFFQVLEGEQSAVEDCYYKRILNDPRHCRLSLYWYGLSERRVFSDWAMGYVGPHEIGLYTKGTFTSLDDINSDETRPANTKELALELARSVYLDFSKKSVDLEDVK
jgi:hypothetical protein